MTYSEFKAEYNRLALAACNCDPFNTVLLEEITEQLLNLVQAHPEFDLKYDEQISGAHSFYNC